MGISVIDAKDKIQNQTILKLRGDDEPGFMHSSIIRYVLENLHPPLFSIISHLTADSFSPESGFQALFFLSNSSMAASARQKERFFLANFYSMILIICPSISLGIFLAWRVDRDARFLGFPKKIRNSWIAVTVLFGLPAWITYRLTRPGIAMISCANCGKLRRPDWKTCQHCKSGWVVSELQPPQWRVFD